MPQVQKLRQVVAHHGLEWPRRACHSSLPQPLQTVSCAHTPCPYNNLSAAPGWK